MKTSTRTLLHLGLLGMVAALAQCSSSGGTSGKETGEACVENDLIEQCPLGSNPILGASAESMCSSSVGGDIVNQRGETTGRCAGSGSCQVVCQFAVACACGVDSVTREEVVCTDCGTLGACGDGECNTGENPMTCPEDCEMECSPGAMRCEGNATIAVCNMQGRFDLIQCASGEFCVQEPPVTGPVMCEREDLIPMDGGDVDSGPPPISGRLQLFDGSWPGGGSAVRAGNARGMAFIGGGSYRPDAPTIGLNRKCQYGNFQFHQCVVNDVLDLFNGNVGLKWGFESDNTLLAFGARRAVRVNPDTTAPSPAMLTCDEWAQASPCIGGNDCTGPGAQQAYDDRVRALGGLGMQCEIDMGLCDMDSECIHNWRTVAYSASVTNPVGLRPAVLSPDHNLLLHSDPLIFGGPMAGFGTDIPIYVYDISAGMQRQLGTSGATMELTDLAMSADQTTAAALLTEWMRSATANIILRNVVLVWDIASGTQTAIAVETGSESLALSPNGEVVALAARLSFVDVYNVDEEKRIYRIHPTGDGCTGGSNVLAFAPEGDQLATAFACRVQGMGTTAPVPPFIELWDAATGTKAGEIQGTGQQPQQITYSPDGTSLLVAWDKLEVWDPATETRVETVIDSPNNFVGGPSGFELSPDATHLAVWGAAGAEERVEVWGQ